MSRRKRQRKTPAGKGPVLSGSRKRKRGTEDEKAYDYGSRDLPGAPDQEGEGDGNLYHCGEHSRKLPGFAVADEVCHINTVDYEAVLKVAREKQIDGIVTAGTDVAVITIGKVCDELGLKGLSFEAARIASDKMLMKERYEAGGVRSARFRRVGLEEDPRQAVRELAYPLIFKAVDSSGSRGITRVNDPSGIPGAVEAVKATTRKDYYIVEEFLEGEEFGRPGLCL